jgi:uncharacterized protein YndB with AHSA1/START domain
MPAQKDFKRVVRRRMSKTGESYTAARAQILKIQPAPTPRRPARVDYAKLAGISDDALKTKTGCTWEKWVKALDHVGAHAWPHRKIADHVHEKYEVPGWWAQTVTVGYERIRGLRDIGQRRGGSYEASKSKTFSVPVAALFEAFAAPRKRSRWLPGVALTVRKATPHKSVRITWGDGTSVEVYLAAKGDDKSSATIQHRKLPDREAVSRTKEYWTTRLAALEQLLKP